MLLINNIGSLATMDEAEDAGLISDAALLIENEHIFWCGPAKKMPARKITSVIDAGRALVMPGLIDCHSHLHIRRIRADEFACRMNNISYSEIMAQGGGISSSVKATNKASDEELYNLAYARAPKNYAPRCYDA